MINEYSANIPVYTSTDYHSDDDDDDTRLPSAYCYSSELHVRDLWFSAMRNYRKRPRVDVTRLSV
jgi:hypothetical protein